jgi:hypothetical protein
VGVDCGSQCGGSEESVNVVGGSHCGDRPACGIRNVNGPHNMSTRLQ